MSEETLIAGNFELCRDRWLIRFRVATKRDVEYFRQREWRSRKNRLFVREQANVVDLVGLALLTNVYSYA